MNGSTPKRIDLIALGLAAGACLVAALLRIFPLEWNFAPVGALALFAGARLRGWLAYAVPVVLLLCTDAVLAMTRSGYSFIHEGTPWVYGSFLLAVLMGRLLSRTENPLLIGGVGLASTVQFFLITNFGAWVGLALISPNTPYSYAPTLGGLLDCYVLGLPFYRGTLAGDMIFTALLFGAHAWLARALPAYYLQPASVHLPAQDHSDEVRRDH